MATTSGTVGATVIDVTTLIEHAFRRCGKMPSTVSGEQQLSAVESLFFLLTALANDGISLWCVESTVIPLYAGQIEYVLPPGTADLLSAVYRTQTALTALAPVSGAGFIGSQFATAVSPSNVQISFTVAGTPALVIESSQDGATWVQVASFPVQQSVLAAGKFLAQDTPNSIAAVYWRVRDTSGTILAGAAVTFSNNPSEIPMSPLNRDDYWALPNKTFLASTSLQYWFDKQMAPVMSLWPVPSVANQIVVRTHRQIQDVGTLTNLVEVPQRWYEYVIFGLAERLACELPTGELPPGRLEYLQGQAQFQMDRAADGETDGAPIRLLPSIRSYTRG